MCSEAVCVVCGLWRLDYAYIFIPFREILHNFQNRAVHVACAPVRWAPTVSVRCPWALCLWRVVSCPAPGAVTSGEQQAGRAARGGAGGGAGAKGINLKLYSRVSAAGRCGTWDERDPWTRYQEARPPCSLPLALRSGTYVAAGRAGCTAPRPPSVPRCAAAAGTSRHDPALRPWLFVARL